MNLRIKLFLNVLALIMLGSCYKDLGNYTYEESNNLSISASDTIFVTQFEKLAVSPKIDFGILKEDDYSFNWRIWSDAIGDTVRKNISSTKALDYTVNEVPGSYTVVLTCQNKYNGVKSYKVIKLRVQGVISEGWMVLHEKNNRTDFDLIMSPYFSPRYKNDIILKDMYNSVNGESLNGRGVQISSYYALGRYQNVVILTDQGGVKLSATTMEKTFDLNTLMFDKEPLKPEAYLYYSYYWALGKGNEVIVSDGRFYINELLGTGFTEPIISTGDMYRASPYAPKWLWTFKSIIYDDLNGRFMSVEQPLLTVKELPKSVGRKFDWNDMKSTLRYMDTGFKRYEYGLFQNWETNKNELYVFDFDVKTNFDIEKYDASGCPELSAAKYFAIGDRGNVFFYATDKKIYQYDYAGTNKGSGVYDVNDGESITGVKILKSTIDRHIPSHPYDNKVLVISTYNKNSKEGKVYMYYINESNGKIDKSSEKIFGGYGEIISMDFNFPKYGT